MEPNECVKSIANQVKQTKDKATKYESKRFESFKNKLLVEIDDINKQVVEYENKLDKYQSRLENIKKASLSSLDKELEDEINSMFLERFF